MISNPKIAIIGGGPGGLTLANLLHRHNIPCTIYELESGPHVRNQGGSLDLHAHSGQRALREAGLYEEFKKYARPEGDAMKLVTSSGKVVWNENDEKPKTIETANRPEIDRIALRNILLNSVKEDIIRWGKKLQSVEQGEGDTYALHFADGVVEKGFDLVVGADGAWSKVRPLLTDAKPFYSGISVIEMWALDDEERHPWLSAYVGAGNCFMFDEGRCLLSQRNGDGSIRVYAGVRQAETWIEDCGIDWKQPETARKELLEKYFGDCGEDLKRVIMEATDELIPRTLYMLPVGLRWDTRPGVTLLGDAAHLMTPFAGIGVNVAMHDALDLANSIIASKDTGSDRFDLAAAVKNYEGPMLERAEKSTQKTFNNMKSHFSASGIEVLMNMMKGRGPPEMS
jgi:2-polyprenyl-6-methoxyphenol hydroxylase-like FAD-dependent oxidoreductase